MNSTITINNFDLAAASAAGGYLGIRLDPTQQLVIAQGSTTDAAGANNPFEAWNFDPATFTGQSAVAEGGASFYTVFLRSAAKNVSAEIKTGQRRVIEYLLSPMQRAGNESLRER